MHSPINAERTRKYSWKMVVPFFFIIILGLLVFSGVSLGVEDETKEEKNVDIITLPWDDKAKQPIPPSFVLPKQSRWGCLSCHSSTKLSKFRGGREVSLFIDEKIIGNSVHKKIACLDCHEDFSYDLHPAGTPEGYSKVAGLACRKCHPYQARVYEKSIHGQLALENVSGRINGKDVDPPTCFDCHGNHDIQSTRFEPYRTEFRDSVKDGEVCAKCHADRLKSWNDYYHGRAYKNSAKDAPICWDCHDNHEILPFSDPGSTINEENLPKTCGKCHDRPSKAFTSYSSLIHGRGKIVENNFVVKLISSIIPFGKDKAPDSSEKEVKTEVRRGDDSKGFLTRIINFFFPPSLRPNSK